MRSDNDSSTPFLNELKDKSCILKNFTAKLLIVINYEDYDNNLMDQHLYFLSIYFLCNILSLQF